jgi:hypothetical protein
MCSAWLICLPIAFVIVLVRAAPHTGLGIGRFFNLLAPPLLACTLMYGAVLGIGTILPPAPDDPFRFVALVATGALVYGAVIMTLRPRDVVELWHFLRT